MCAGALAISAKKPYRQVYRMLARANKEAGGRRSARDGMPKKVWHKVARKLLLVKVKLPKGSRPTFTEAHRLYGNCLVTTTKHVCALVNGELLDTHDCRSSSL